MGPSLDQTLKGLKDQHMLNWSGAPNKNISAKYCSIFCFLRLFQSFSKAYLCKLIEIDLFGILAENLGHRKF